MKKLRHVRGWRRTALSALTWSLVFVLSGCGTIINGTSRSVTFVSDPDSVNVRIQETGQEIVTPGSVELKTKRGYTLIAEKEGYKKQIRYLEKQLNETAVIFDAILCLFFLIPGAAAFAIDAGTGGLWKLDENVYFNMQPAQATPATSP